MTLPYRGPRIPPRGPSGASRPPAQPTFTLDVMEFIEESKRIERHKAREALLARIESIAVTQKRSGSSWDYSSEERSVHDVKRDMLAAVKVVLE